MSDLFQLDDLSVGSDKKRGRDGDDKPKGAEGGKDDDDPFAMSSIGSGRGEAAAGDPRKKPFASRWVNDYNYEFPIAPLRANPNVPAPFIPPEQQTRQPIQICRAGPLSFDEQHFADTPQAERKPKEADVFYLDELHFADTPPNRFEPVPITERILQKTKSDKKSPSASPVKASDRLVRMQPDYVSSNVYEEELHQSLSNIKDGKVIEYGSGRTDPNWPPKYPEYLQRKGIIDSIILESLYPPAEFVVRESDDGQQIKFERIPGKDSKAQEMTKKKTVNHVVYFKSDMLGYGTYGEVYQGAGSFSLPQDDGKALTIVRPLCVKILKRYGHTDRRKFTGNQVETYNHPLDFMALSALNHSNVVLMYDYTFLEGIGYIAIMELLRGGELSKYYERWREFRAKLNNAFRFSLPPGMGYNTDSLDYAMYGAVPEVMVRTIVLQLLDGLVFCHFHGVAHQDIKPANIMIDRHGTFKFVDFGLAIPYFSVPQQPYKPGDLEGGHTQQMRFAISGAGTATYMPPEVLRYMGHVRLPWGSRTDYDPSKADVYSIGVLTYVLYLSVIPFPVSFDNGEADFGYAYDVRSQDETHDTWWRVQINHRQQYLPVSESFKSFISQTLNPDWKIRPTAVDLVRDSEWLAPHVDSLWAFHIKMGQIVR